MKTGKMWLSRVVMLAGFVFACGGCIAGGEEPNPYAAEYAAAMEDTDSEYVRRILEDGKITAEEYRDSHQQHLACLSEAGIWGNYEESGLGTESLVTYDLTQEERNSMAACWDKWSGPIDALYEDRIVNPQNEDLDSLIASCLVRKRLAPEGFTGTAYAELMAQNSMEVSVDVDNQQRMKLYELDYVPPVVTEIPGGASLSDPEVELCQMSPLK